MKIEPLLLGLLLTSASAAQEAPDKPTPASQGSSPAQLEKVEVKGPATAAARRKASTASKIVIDREELSRYGDTQLGDVLRRLPGVTIGGRPGRGGDIRMRGLGGGFTQILMDGERAPAGFSVEQLPPDQVERIEIYLETLAEQLRRTQTDRTETIDDNATLGAKWSLQTTREHQWVTGLELEAGQR